MSVSKDYKAFYRALLEHVEKSGKQSTIIHSFANKDRSSAAHTICVCLQKNLIGGALEILIHPSNANDSEKFLLLVKDEFGCNQKISDKIQYENVAEKIDARNVIGYFAYFLLDSNFPACGAIMQKLQELSQEKEQKNPASQKITVMETEIQKLKDELLKAKQEQQEQKETIRQIRREKSELESQTQALTAQADETKSLKEKIKQLLISNEKLDAQIKQLSQEEKSWTNNRSDETIEKTSLFFLEENNMGRYLQRAADFDGDRLTHFASDNVKEKRFDNRDYFAFQMKRFDGLSIGTAQILDWFAQPMPQDPKKDIADVILKSARHPIELIDLHAPNVDVALQSLKDGFQWLYFEENGQYLYALTHRDDGTVETLFCPKGTLKKGSDTIHINPDIVSLEQYSIMEKDLLAVSLFCVGKEIRVFYVKLELGELEKRVLLCTPVEMAEHFVREYATETKLKNIISGRQNWQAFRGFINTECMEPICSKIASECDLSEEIAKTHLNQYLDYTEQYLSGTDEDTRLVSALVERNPALLKKYKAIAQEEWEKVNAAKLKTAGEQLTAQSTLLQDVQREREKLSGEIRMKQDELASLEQEIGFKRQLGEDTLCKVRQKICQARKDTAGFLAELSVYFPQPEIAVVENGKQKESAMFYEGLPMEKGVAEEKNSVSDLLDVLYENMEDAGVDESHVRATATWLLSAYCEHVPLLLAGPAVTQLADALSCGISGRRAARLTCDGAWNQEIANQAVKSDSKVILVENPFREEWAERLPPLILNSGKLFLFATPFEEDLSIEPKGLYQYMLPIFTDSFINTVPKEPETGSVWTGPFPELKGNGEGIYRMSFLKPNGLLRTQANRLFRRFENLLKKPADFYEFLLCILPLAKATGNEKEAADEIRDSKRLNEDEQKNLLVLLG